MLAILLLAACVMHFSQQEDPTALPIVDNDLQEYVDAFYADMELYLGPDIKKPKIYISVVNGLSTSFTSRIATNNFETGEIIGICRPRFDGFAYSVSIDKRFYLTNSKAQIKLLVYHELAHCILLKGHDDTTLANGYPASIMASFIVSDSMFKELESYYVQELFSDVNKEAIGFGQIF